MAAPPSAGDAGRRVAEEQTASMRAAVAAHKRGALAEAERLYRRALAAGPHPGARILLANLLLAT